MLRFVNTIIDMFLAYILQEYLGYTPSMSLILASVAFTQYAVFSWPPYFYIDRIGRRWSVMGSSAGCAICMAVIAGGLAAGNFSGAAAAVAFMFLYLDCFTLGILPVSWYVDQNFAGRYTLTKSGLTQPKFSPFAFVTKPLPLVCSRIGCRTLSS